MLKIPHVLLRAIARQITGHFGWLISAIFFTVSVVMTGQASAGIYYIKYTAPDHTNVGTTFAATVTASMVKDSAATGYVSGTLLYPSQLVTLVRAYAVDYPGLKVSSTTGTISISASSLGAGNGYGGFMTVLHMDFTAKASGTASFAAQGGSIYLNGTNHIVQASSMTIYAQNCPSGQTGTPPNCTTPPPPAPTPSPTPAPTPTPTPNPVVTVTPSPTNSNSTKIVLPTGPVASPILTNEAPVTSSGGVAISESSHSINTNVARLVFKSTDILHDMHFTYGITKTKLTKTSDVSLADTSLTIDVIGLTPGTRYYYSLQGKDKSEAQLAYDSDFVTEGLPIRITLMTNKLPATDRSVRINGQTYTSDKSGLVVATVPPGKLAVTDMATRTVRYLTVKNIAPQTGKHVAEQSFTMNVVAVRAAAQSGTQIAVVLGCLLLAGAVIGGLWWHHRRITPGLMTLHVDPYADFVAATHPEQVSSGQTMTDELENSSREAANIIMQKHVSLADEFKPPPKKVEPVYDPFLQDSPFARDKPFPERHVSSTEHHKQTSLKHHHKAK